jgi:RNA polymerase sigma-70 factor (ECF subfamily)
MTHQRREDGMEREERFEALFRAHLPRVRAYVARRVAEGVEDAVAETFTVAWRRLDDVPAGDAARPWLYGVARRVLANHHRGERRRSALVGDLAGRLRTDLAAHRPAAPEGDLAAVAAAFGELSDDDRELLALVGWEGLDRAEIAAVLGCSRNAVRIRLHRARRRLARALDRHEAPAPHAHALPAAVINGERA